MKYKQHRVMVRNADGAWVEIYQGRVGECEKFKAAMKLRDRKRLTPMITRRSVEEWQEIMTTHGSQAASSSPTRTCAAEIPTTESA
ncbi:hypothetical protein HOV23_gp083 [Pseudomonas phage Lana]|uniref:Uncharacterized protein n=1 Tax=Pseudomonas phage Lana TaxID=2530172 RepID=A0A481W6W7_9CAUD|nr:hypothetical protein HOV23_gp083 [Pseudomonas phage Lana]QBJ04490.1 hypothetical protein [Pseudomonas phage Lana]